MIDPVTVLPHGAGFRFVTGVRAVDETMIEAFYQVPDRPFWFDDHFPGNPIMPGVLQVEMMAQAMIVHYRHTRKIESDKMLFAAADQVRFKQQVRPGQRLEIKATLLDDRRGFVKYECEASSSGLVVSGKLTGALGR